VAYAEENALQDDSQLFWMQLWSAYHPQRIPERVLAQYRNAVSEEGAAPLLARSAVP
jgi:hypothetical protein